MTVGKILEDYINPSSWITNFPLTLLISFCLEKYIAIFEILTKCAMFVLREFPNFWRLHYVSRRSCETIRATPREHLLYSDLIALDDESASKISTFRYCCYRETFRKEKQKCDQARYRCTIRILSTCRSMIDV
jgi:hypothetical protein